MTMNLLKYALRNHFTDRARMVLMEEIDKLIDDWRDCNKQNPLDTVANERLAILRDLKMSLERVDGEYVSTDTFNVRTEVTTNYLPAEDMTIVWKNLYVCDELVQRALVGFYCGEPDEKATYNYSFSSTIAEYV